MQDKVLDMEKVRLGRCWGNPGEGEVTRGPSQGEGAARGTSGTGPGVRAPCPSSPHGAQGTSLGPCLLLLGLHTRVWADGKLGPSPSDPLKPWRYTRACAHTHTSIQKATRLHKGCARPHVSGTRPPVRWPSWAPWAVCVPLRPWVPGLERGEGKAKAQAHQGCSPPWRHHPGGHPLPPAALQGAPGLLVPSQLLPHRLLSQFPVRCQKGGAPATRGQHSPTGRSHAPHLQAALFWVPSQVGCLCHSLAWGHRPLGSQLPACPELGFPPLSLHIRGKCGPSRSATTPPTPTPRLKQGSGRTSCSELAFGPRGWSMNLSSLSPWEARIGPKPALSASPGRRC